jgi:uncharacterized protein YllA (UPF0747 family)
VSAFSPAFLSGDPRASAFLPDHFRHEARRAESVRRALGRKLDAQAARALEAQARRVPGSAARLERLARLADGTAVAVVTGQQVGLFLGPAYSLYKAASAVVVARALSEQTGVQCVPVFWLQSEDHDFVEIDHVTVHGRDGELTRLQVASPHVPRASVSSITLGTEVDGALAGLRAALETLPHADEVVALFARHYRAAATWVGAFAGVMAELFDELVLVDPRDEVIARAVRPVHERAFEEREEINRLLLEREAALEAAGFDVQVRVRDVPLSFVHPEGRDGPRHRGEKIVSDDPLCLSSSALLRPIIQDTLLPTAAIIGGPGELNYFAQLSPLYGHFGLPMPMVMPRARFRVVEPRARAVLSELGLSAAEVEVPREVLLRRVVQTREGEPTPAQVEQRLIDAVAPILAEVAGADEPRSDRTKAPRVSAGVAEPAETERFVQSASAPRVSPGVVEPARLAHSATAVTSAQHVETERLVQSASAPRVSPGVAELAAAHSVTAVTSAQHVETERLVQSASAPRVSPGVAEPAQTSALIGRVGASSAGDDERARASLPRLRGLERAVERTRRSFARAAQRFAARYGRDRLERDAIATARVDRVQRALFPDGAPQERVLGIAGFAARVGVKVFVQQVLAGVTPFGTDVKELP